MIGRNDNARRLNESRRFKKAGGMESFMTGFNRANALLQRMTLRQKLGQMLGIRGGRSMLAAAAEGSIGALNRTMVAGETGSAADVVAGVNRYRAVSPVPPLCFYDAEYGMYQYFRFGTSFPSMMALGATFSEELAYRMGNVIGKEARAVGFGMIHSPCVDISSNPDNPIVSIRSLGSDPEWVTRLACAFVAGMQEAGVMANAKHFPGHGDTNEDSHSKLPIVNASKELLLQRELAPYRELFRQGVAGVMTAHIVYPALLGADEPPNLPATFSSAVVTKLLREEMGFEGLAVSDSLSMAAVADGHDPYRAAVLAVKAGHDILLSGGGDPEKELDALELAVASGELDEEEIDRSVSRILHCKERFGLLDNELLDVQEAERILALPEHRDVAEDIAARAVTRIEGRRPAWSQGGSRNILMIATYSPEEGKRIDDLGVVIEAGSAVQFYEQLKRYGDRIELCLVADTPGEDDCRKVEAALERSGFDEVLYVSFVRVTTRPHSGTISGEQQALIRNVHERFPEMTYLLMGSPYALRLLPRFEHCLCSFSPLQISYAPVLEALYGVRRTTGRLPVHVNSIYPLGYMYAD